MLPSVSAQRQAVVAKQNESLAMAYSDYAVAQRLLAKGKLGAAKMVLRNARRRGDLELKRRIDEQYAEIAKASESKLVAR